MGRKVYSNCPIRLRFHRDDMYFENGVEVQIEDGDEIVAPPLSEVNAAEIGDRIVSAMNPLSNGHRKLTLRDWVRLDEAIRHVLDTAGEIAQAST